MPYETFTGIEHAAQTPLARACDALAVELAALGRALEQEGP